MERRREAEVGMIKQRNAVSSRVAIHISCSPFFSLSQILQEDFNFNRSFNRGRWRR